VAASSLLVRGRQNPVQIAAAGAAAQASAPQAAAPLRVATRLVEVSVLVNDKKGEPVSGLTKDDFTLLDAGKPQKISFLSAEKDQTRSPRGVVTNPAPNVFSNSLANAPSVPRSVTVILIDSLNTSVSDMGYAREQMVKFLHQLHPSDRVALYSLSSKLMVLHEFTQDASSLLAALDHYKDTGSFEERASETNVLNRGNVTANDAILGINAADQGTPEGREGAAKSFTLDRIRITAAALEAIANHVASLPGRKNLVWVSASFPINIGALARVPLARGRPHEISSAREIEAAARALNDANVAIYPVDARAIIPSMDMLSDSSKMGPKGRGGLPMMGSTVEMTPAPENFETMDEIAAATGGRAFYNTNDIDVSLRRAIDDSRDSYLLGYYPSNAKWDGSFHEIRVEVKQRHVELRYRRGYYAFAAPQTEAQLQLANTTDVPLESTSLGITVRMDPVTGAVGRRFKADIRLDTARMLFREKDERWLDHLDIVWVQLDADDHTLTSNSESLDLKLSSGTYQKAQREGLGLNTTLEVRGDATRLRLVVRDGGAGTIGSVHIPLSAVLAPATPGSANR
jgi:VWFA-related protein